MKNDKKQDILIDAISGIDEDIIDKNLEKRFKLWNKKGSNRKLYVSIISVAAALCLIFSGVFVYLLGNTIIPVYDTSIPVYEGMTVETTPPATLEANNEIGLIPISANYGNTVRTSKLSSNTLGTAPSDNSTTPDSGELPLFGETYYAMQNEDIYIHIHLTNPEDFEILSFTLNGIKYTTYMFEPGSNTENLILKYNVGNVTGLQEYTIDAIKYVDGEQIKDVKMKGDRTVRVFVNGGDGTLDLAPTLSFQTLTISPKWNDSFDGEKKITSLKLYEGGVLLRELSPEETVITKLPLGKRLILKATYLDGGEEKTVSHVFSTPKQSEGLTISNGKITGIGSCTDSVLYFDMPIADGFYLIVPSNKHITAVYFSSNVTSIGNEAFQCFSEIREIILPDELKYIGEYAFFACTNTKIVIPEGVETIPAYAFYGGDTKEVFLPSTLKSLPMHSFFGNGDATVHYNGTKAQWKDITINDWWFLMSESAESATITINCTDGVLTYIIKDREPILQTNND